MYKKLKNQNGATLLFALAALLLSAMVCALIISAAEMNVRRIKLQQQAEQQRLTLNSAAMLVREQIAGLTLEFCPGQEGNSPEGMIPQTLYTWILESREPSDMQAGSAECTETFIISSAQTDSENRAVLQDVELTLRMSAPSADAGTQSEEARRLADGEKYRITAAFRIKDAEHTSQPLELFFAASCTETLTKTIEMDAEGEKTVREESILQVTWPPDQVTLNLKGGGL